MELTQNLGTAAECPREVPIIQHIRNSSQLGGEYWQDSIVIKTLALFICLFVYLIFVPVDLRILGLLKRT